MYSLLVAATVLWPAVRPQVVPKRPNGVTGVVVAVGDSTITLSTPEFRRQVMRPVKGVAIPGARKQPPGAFVAVTLVSPAQPQEGMFLSQDLRKGGIGDDLKPFRYPLREVRVGDHVSVAYYRLYGVMEVVTAIQINRRPGGHLPPCPTDHALIETVREPLFKAGRGWEDLPYGFQPHHAKVNALEDWVSYGIPIPQHLHPGGKHAMAAPPPRKAGTPPKP